MGQKYLVAPTYIVGSGASRERLLSALTERVAPRRLNLWCVHRTLSHEAPTVVNVHGAQTNSKTIRDVIKDWIKDNPTGQLIFTGHSLGGAVTQLLALSVIQYVEQAKRPMKTPLIFTFAAPRIGSRQVIMCRPAPVLCHARAAGGGPNQQQNIPLPLSA
jgi:predicted alpha/beta-fold hydrolase